MVAGMPQMVNRLLSGGYIYLLDILGSEALREEVWSDPVLRGVLSRYTTPTVGSSPDEPGAGEGD
jgi:hypothetical protein